MFTIEDGREAPKSLVYIYVACLGGICLFLCLYPINVKTAEPIGPKICEATHMTQGKVYGCSKACYCFIFYNENLNCSPIQKQIRVDIEDGLK